MDGVSAFVDRFLVDVDDAGILNQLQQLLPLSNRPY